MKPHNCSALYLFACWAAALILAWAVYSQGLPGSFIFDDAPNLSKLSAIQEGAPSELLGFTLQGIAGPSGRPLSLLSFALQHESWPEAPEAFKRVNILIHMINASLVLWLLIVIQQARAVTGNARIVVPLAAATLWLLWPIHVSSVLYVVQRMTLLSATSMLAGLLLYTYARRLGFDAGRQWQAHLLLLLSLGVGVGIGVLCKENAIVFPFLALALNATLLSAQPAQPRWWTALLWLPIFALLAYLLTSKGAFAGYSIRDFDMVERLLTQPRILWMYVQQILLPSTESLRFLYDSYVVSRSLISPLTTLLALILLLATLAWAWQSRRRHPVFAFAVLFFLGSHVLESTVLPLELVFEHRNYIGAVALAFAAATAGYGLVSAASSKSGRTTFISLCTGYLVAISVVSWNLTNLWANPMLQKRLWLQRNADSPRVHMEYAHQLALEGYADEAVHRLEIASSRFPEEMGFTVARVELACYYPDVKPASLVMAEEKLRAGTKGAMQATSFLDRLVVAMTENNCSAYAPEEALSLTMAAHENPAFSTMRQDTFVLSGVLHSHIGDTVAARHALQQAIGIYPKPQLLLQGAVWEISNENWDQAALYLNALRNLQKTSPRQSLAIRNELRKLELLYSSAKKAKMDQPRLDKK